MKCMHGVANTINKNANIKTMLILLYNIMYIYIEYLAKTF